MKLTKDILEELYSRMSLEEIAAHLGVAKSTLYYQMKKLGIERRSKSDAQLRHINTAAHQRLGKQHSDDTKERIANGTREFWESESGKKQKEKLGNLRREEWKNCSPRQRTKVLNRLQLAARPEPGSLSRFGTKLAAFLSQTEDVKTGIRVTPTHISDIILEGRKVVIELLLPISIYGEIQEQKIGARYERLVSELNDAGYRVFIIQDKSNSISKARCQRVHNELLRFFDNNSLQYQMVVS